MPMKLNVCIFLIEDDELLEKYYIWKKVSNSIKTNELTRSYSVI